LYFITRSNRNNYGNNIVLNIFWFVDGEIKVRRALMGKNAVNELQDFAVRAIKR